jgi:hypothetical protein
MSSQPQPSAKPDDFLPQRPFPEEATGAERPRRPAGGGTFSRYVLPVVLFVAIVGVIAWVVQNMPGWKTRNGPIDNGGPAPDGSLLTFMRTTARWEREVEAEGAYLIPCLLGILSPAQGPEQFGFYAALRQSLLMQRLDMPREFERGVPGYYDFLFKNPSDKAVEFGLLRPSCDCVSIEACLLPSDQWAQVASAMFLNPGTPAPYAIRPDWKDLEMSKDQGLLIPAGGQGVVRVNWKGGRKAGEALNLKPTFWSQPQGDPRRRYDSETLTVPIVMAVPYLFHPEKSGVGALGAKGMAKAHYFFWSTTRDHLDLSMAKTLNSLFEWQIRPLSPYEFAELEQTLENANRNRQTIKSAYKLTVTAYEQKDGKEMPLGPFWQDLPILLNELPQEPVPVVYGMIRGEVEVGTDNLGRIKLEPFPVKRGTREAVSLWTEGKVQLETQDQTPLGLEVKLTRLAKESTPQRSKWRLDVIVPPDAVEPGSYTEERSVVTLRITTNPPRPVRIPVSFIALAE